MITIRDINTLDGKTTTITLPGIKDQTIEAEGKLTFLPGVIDTFVNFNTHKEIWITEAKAAIAGGVTAVFATGNLNTLNDKKQAIETQLSEANIPLRCHFYAVLDTQEFDSIAPSKKMAVGIHIQMEKMRNEKSLDRLFQLAAQENILLSVHAEDFNIIQDNLAEFEKISDPAVHSKIRSRHAAIHAVEKAITLAEKYNTQLFIQNISTKDEVELVRKAKGRSILVYGGVAAPHLFLTETDYAAWGTKVQVDPALRTKEDQEALWKGIRDKVIDTVCSGHHPYTLLEKQHPYGKAPSGIPGVETLLPLLLNAYNERKIKLDEIVHLTRINPESIFNLSRNRDAVLVDLSLEKKVHDSQFKSHAGWSPFSGRTLKGWPIYTIVNQRVFKAN